MLLDYITGNSDRHNGNYLITDDGKMVAIDNGMVGGIYAPHDTQASLTLNPSSFGYLSFPYGLSDEIDKRSKGGEKPTKEELANEAAKFFDKYYDKDKLDAVLTTINWKSFFVEGHNQRPIEGTPETMEYFKKRFVERATVNFEDAYNTGYDYDSYRATFDDSIGVITTSGDIKRELAAEGINIDAIHALNLNENPIIEFESTPNVYEEDEFN